MSTRGDQIVGTIENLQEFVGENLSLLAPVDQTWQPTDFLPDLAGEDWTEQLARFRGCCRCLADDLLIVLVGNMVTEEALPNYAVSLEQIARDPTGTGETPWARWLRGWTAEENRHGDLLNAYLRLSGRVDMRSVERTVHHLIRNGFTYEGRGSEYGGLLYAAFQERATRVTHANVGRLAAEQGEPNLARICRKIAGDEARHEVFYTRVVGQLMEGDAEGTVMAYWAMLKGLVTMPGNLMHDGRDPSLFDQYAGVTQRTGVYTVRDYAAIIGHLNDAWDIGRQSLSGKAARAQDYVCRQPERYELLADEIADRFAERPAAGFSWIHSRRTLVSAVSE
jgi:acyl-[acyl-carrier-protein] desaturase